MESSSPEIDPKYFGFTDLHGFKDFVAEVIVCAPDKFIPMDWLGPESQMNLDRAFIGLRYGLNVATREKGETELLRRCRELIEAAYADYRDGRENAGQSKLEQFESFLKELA